jgi:hypothetical protein
MISLLFGISYAKGCKLVSIIALEIEVQISSFVAINDTAYYTRCFKKSFTTLKAYRNLYRGHTQRFGLSKCSKTHRVLPRIVIRNCFDLRQVGGLPHYQWKSH